MRCVLPHAVMDGMMWERYPYKVEEREWVMTEEDWKDGRRFCQSVLLCPPGACLSWKSAPPPPLNTNIEDVCPSLAHPDRFNLTSLKSVLVAYFDKLSIVCYIDHINIICLKIVHCIFLCSLHKSSDPVQTDVYLSGSNSPVFLASPM